MDILIVRHAIAEERDFDKWPDDRGRPLTRAGAQRFQSVARVLGRIIEAPDHVLASPLRRTWETAEILEETCSWPAPEELPALEPGRDPEETVAWLRRQPGFERLVLVGHEPSLHELLARLIGMPEGAPWEMKKGGAALVRFERKIRAGEGALIWLAPPHVLLAGG